MGEEDMINFKDKNAQYVAKYYKADMEKFSRHNIFKVYLILTRLILKMNLSVL